MIKNNQIVWHSFYIIFKNVVSKQNFTSIFYVCFIFHSIIDTGAKIHDTCDRDTIALEKSISFVSDHFLLNSDEIVNDFVCEATNPENLLTSAGKSTLKFTPKKLRKNIHRRKVLGVIGAASSSVSVQVANLLRLFKVKFRHFLRRLSVFSEK
jgi:hypothetical protein